VCMESYRWRLARGHASGSGARTSTAGCVVPLDAQDLGPYGWRVDFFAGGEHAHLYVGPDGRFRFYFVSWGRSPSGVIDANAAW